MLPYVPVAFSRLEVITMMILTLIMAKLQVLKADEESTMKLLQKFSVKTLVMTHLTLVCLVVEWLSNTS